MNIKNLSGIPHTQIADCLLIAFENYYVKMPTDYQYWQKRWQAARVNYELSAGVFDDDTLVGFILHGVDENENGEKIAFNCGTGVLPEYRKRGIVGDLYHYLIPYLKSHNIDKCGLEVITMNEIAINSYKKVGFEIVKRYKSFFGSIKMNDVADVDTFRWSKAAAPDFDSYDKLKMCHFSWENNDHALKAVGLQNFDTWELRKDNSIEGYAITKPNGHIIQFGASDSSVLEHVFYHLGRTYQDVRIINIEEQETELTDFLIKCGLSNNIDQYYMEFSVN